MGGRRTLVLFSAAQLVAGVAGQVLALRDRRAFDIAVIGWRGKPERVLRDSWFLGTGLSAPVVMLVAQAVATSRLAAAPSPGAARTLQSLGAVMTFGYLVEREFREAFTASGRRRLVTPVAAAGFAGAVAMATCGDESGNRLLPQRDNRRIV